MDWMNRGVRQNQAINQPVSHPAGQMPAAGSKGKRYRQQRWLKMASVTLLFSATLLVVALLLYTAFGGNSNSENKLVDSSKYQAVFLNGGQVYFGHINTLNSKYLRLSNIFYLRVNQQVQPNSTTAAASSPELVPLGCELHRPQSQMQINRDQVVFWENLKEDTDVNTVPGAIKKYIADNPSGQKCAAASTSTTPTTTKKP